MAGGRANVRAGSRATRSSLSVCCMTVDPPSRVAASLALVRPVAHEIVVAVDAMVPPDALGPLHDVADRVVRFEYRPPVDRPRPWLVAQCSGDWILTLDGDEVPGPALVEQLPELISRGGTPEDVVQVHVPRRWLFPDSGSWLAELPWWPDYQVRLVRNDASLAVRTGVHAGIVPVLPARHLDAPLYHLDPVVTDPETRRSKVAAYESLDPGRAAYGGGPLNEVLYGPEVWATQPPQPVPEADRLVIDRVLAAGAAAGTTSAASDGSDARRSAPSAPLIPAEEIDRFRPPHTGTLPDDAYKADLAVFAEGLHMVPSETRPVYVRVSNLGTVTWPWGLDQEPYIRLSYHWRDGRGEMLVYEGLRSPLPCRVAPGDTTIVPLWVTAPLSAGRYVLEIELVHEHVRWFGSPLAVDINVAERPAGRPPPHAGPRGPGWLPGAPSSRDSRAPGGGPRADQHDHRP